MDDSPRTLTALYVRNFVFGVEDSLVSTVGLLSGIAAAGIGRNEILLSGTVLIFVEAFSMGVGSFLSEESTEEYVARASVAPRRSVIAGVIMLISYFISGFVPLFPYVVFEPARAFSVSIGLSLAALFILGLVSGRLAGTGAVRSASRMLVMGGLAVAIGIGVGSVIR